MSFYSMTVSLKEKRRRKKTLEELTEENAALKDRLGEMEAGMTDLQVALCSLYEAGGGEAE